jgi:crotonobetainyl-CoA:carnitine CoA-transferase CaiB-like acyl-CoA transferase
MTTEKSSPLAGVKVVDLTHQMAGPTCGLMLADMGADVVKVEKIGIGDDTRRMRPPEIEGESAAFMMMNRNKRGIVLDLKTEGGKRVLKRMLESADIAIENYRADTMAKLGLGYDDLKEANPGLVYGSISGFGKTGPYADRGGFDLIAQAMSGIMSVTGEGGGRPPVKVGPPVCDITAGILLTVGVLAAYAERLKTGQGQMVETSLLEAGITHTFWQSAICFATGTAPEAMGTAHPLAAPYQAVRTKDGYIVLGAANAKLWLDMLNLIGAPELARDPRFVENGDRLANREALIAALEARFETRTSADWLDALAGAGVPAGPIHDVKEMHEDQHTLAREMVVEVEHPVAGPVKTIGHPLKFSRTPGKVAFAAPVFGQHTAEVLAEYGFDEAEIRALADEGALHLGQVPQAAAAE